VTQFLSLLLNGLSLGSIYALIALGFVVIFKSSEVVSFMHGSLLLFGAYLIAVLQGSLGFWGAVVVGVALTGLLGLVIDLVILDRLRGAAVISLAILTIGLDIVLSTELTRRIGSDILNINHPWGGNVVHLGSVGITANRAIAMAVAAVLIGLFFVAFKYSSWGVAMRASAEDGEAAALMGIRLRRVSSMSWVIGGALAAVAGMFLVGSPTPGLTPSVGAVALRAFPAAILGGLDSTGGALVGGLMIGVAESLADGYQDQLLFLGRGFGAVVPYVVMLVVLLIRPSGLFGTRELTRV
jgi:branched-chain amino acid transport system permease protein